MCVYGCGCRFLCECRSPRCASGGRKVRVALTERVGSEGEEECGAGEKSSSGQLERIQGQLGAPWALWQALCVLPVLLVRER